MSSIVEVLRSVSLFSDFPDDALQELSQKVESLSLPKNTLLFKEGDEGDAMYFIVQGEISIFGKDDKGAEIVFSKLGYGEYFGEMSLLDGKPRSAGAKTTTKVELLKLNREDFSGVVNLFPALALKLVNQFTTRLRDNVQILEAAISESTEALKLDDAQKGTRTRVFVSYSRRDKDFVRKLHESLVAKGFDVWVDWEGIPLGTDWWQEIVDGIQRCDNFVFVISPDSVASKVCADEIQTAIDSNKRLVPVLYREEKGMVAQIRAELQAINFTFMRTDEEFKNLLPELVATLQTDLTHVKAHTRLQNLALEWERKKHSSSLVLRGEELESAETWLAHAGGKQPPPSSLQGEYIQASRRDANRRQRQFLTLVTAALVISLLLVVVAGFSYVRAENNRVAAVTAEANAEVAEAVAKDNEAYAQVQRVTAEAASTQAVNEQSIAQREASAASTAEAKAVEQREAANEQRSIAEEQRQIADAQRLASQAEGDLTRGNLLTRSILLAIASMRKARNYQADLALRVGLDVLPSRLYVKAFDNPVVKVVYSPDGERLAIAEQNGLIEFWDSAYGNKVLEIQDVGKITDMVFTPDGTQFITASEDGTARVWNPTTGDEIYRLEHGGPVRAVAVSTNGYWLATASDDQYARSWNLRTGKQVASVYHTAGVTDVDFSPGGSWVASTGKDRAVILWTPTTGVKHLTMYHDTEVNLVLFGPMGSFWMATASRGGTVTIWNPQTGSRLAQLSHEQDVVAMTYSPDGKWLATASLDNTARIWEPDTGRALAQLRHDRQVLAVAFSADGQWVATGSLDNTARVWDPKTGRETARMEHGGAVSTLSFTPNALLLTTGSRDGTVTVWSPEAVGQALLSLHHPAPVIDLDYSPDEAYLATAASDRVVRVWEVAREGEIITPTVIISITVSSDIIDVDFSKDGQFLATGTKDGLARIWNAKTGELVKEFSHDGEVLDVDFSRDGLWLLTGSGDGKARVWDITTGEAVHVFQHGGPVGEVSLKADGTQLATASLDKTARIWEVATETELQHLEHPAGVFLVNFVSETNWLVTVSQDNVVRFWDDTTGELLDRFFVDSQIRAIEINPDGSKLAVTGDDNIARVWEIRASGNKISLTEVSRVIHLGVINDVVYGNDGRVIATASNDRTVLISLLLPAELIDKACSQLTRNLSQVEWTQFFEGEIYELTCPNLPPDPLAIEALKAEVGRLGADGDYNGAVDMMRHIQALIPTVPLDIAAEIRRLSIATIIDLGITEAQEGVFDLAYADYSRVITFDSFESSPRYLEFLASLCLVGGTETGAVLALPLCDLALVAYPEDALLFAARAQVYAWQGDFEQAINDLTGAIALLNHSEIGTDEQFMLDTWAEWINQLKLGENPFLEQPPS